MRRIGLTCCAVLRTALALALGAGCELAQNATGRGESAEVAAPGSNPETSAGPGAAPAADTPADEGVPPDLGVLPRPIVPTQEPIPSAVPQRPSAAATATIVGVVTDLGNGDVSLGLAGPGTTSLASHVRISALGDGLAPVAEVSLDEEHGYTAAVSLDLPLLIVEVFDAAGRMLGAVALVNPAATPGGLVRAAPVTAESSLEVQVLVNAAACPCGRSNVASAVSLALHGALLIDAELGAELVAASATGLELSLMVGALADGITAAGHARLAALREAGVEPELAALAQAELAALASFQGSLGAGSLSEAERTTQLLADSDRALRAAGAHAPDVRVRAQVASSLGFSLSLRAALAGRAGLEPLTFAALRSGGLLEAHAAAIAVPDLLMAANATQAATDTSRAAGARMIAEVAASHAVGALVSARERYVAALYGDAQGDGLLADLLPPSADLLPQTAGLLSGLLDPTRARLASLSAELDAALRVELAPAAGARLCDGSELASAVAAGLHGAVTTLSQFQLDMRALNPARAGRGASALAPELLASVLSSAEVVLRAPF